MRLLSAIIIVTSTVCLSAQKATVTLSGFGISNYMSGDGKRVLAECTVNPIGTIKECVLTKDTMLADLVAELRARENDACKHGSTTVPQKQEFKKNGEKP